MEALVNKVTLPHLKGKHNSFLSAITIKKYMFPISGSKQSVVFIVVVAFLRIKSICVHGSV